MAFSNRISWVAFLLYKYLSFVDGSILSTAAIDVRNLANPSQSYTLYASQGEFGRYPKMKAEQNAPMTAFLSPDDDPLLCNEADGMVDYTEPVALYTQQKTVLVVPRGSCSFERKALAAQRLGAAAIIIYGNLASRYSVNTTTNEIIFPQPFHDYDCKFASSFIQESLLSFEPSPYNSQINDPLLSGSDTDGNVCAKHQPKFNQQCPSQRCLLTGTRKIIPTDASSTESFIQACCAWDTYIWLYTDTTIDNRTESHNNLVSIQAFYITMNEAALLLETIQSVPQQQLTLTMYTRYAPDASSASFLIWLLGIFVAALSSYLSAGDIRHASRQLMHKTRKLPMDNKRSMWGRGETIQGEEEDENSSSVDDDTEKNKDMSSTTQAHPHRIHSAASDTVEMTVSAAIAFMLLSTVTLLFLFYFKIYGIVKVLYGLGSGSALAQVVFIPFFTLLLTKCNMRDQDYYHIKAFDIGSVNRSEILAYIVSFSLSITWVIASFIIPHPGEYFFFWFLQDVIGICMCITFLQVIQVNNIKVASILLIIAFFYDIFFVFISPHLTGGKSIMIDVATSGGPPQADPNWCEKYPRNAECRGGDPLPVLLTIPRFDDYRGGSALLGLGDILLPGLLLSFAARYDEAKMFWGLLNGGRGRIYSPNTCPEVETCSKNYCLNRMCMGGYLFPLVVSYAVGLSMANIAVNVMRMGQPALLYLVPCCLGTICILGWRRGELQDFWDTPKVLKQCYEYLQSDENSSLLSKTDECHTPQTCTEINEAERNEVQSPLLKIS
jgi:signal peptide peptidase-like protein 2B